MNDIHKLTDSTEKALIEEGNALRRSGNYRDAAKRYLAAAELGSAEGLYLAGVNARDALLSYPVTVCSPRVLLQEEAEYRRFDCFSRSAEAGYLPAMIGLGEMYLNGCLLFSPNPEKAVLWYTRALRLGGEEAREPLACCYERGIGVEKNAEAAKKIRLGSFHF